ncbi:MAG: four helix bundle protein [Bacteroidota bacterium]
MRNFRELEVWKEARTLVKEIYILTGQLPESEKFSLVSQMRRCAVSTVANIAEGCTKYSQNDFVRFLQIGLGSLYELETHLIICSDLQFITEISSTKTIEKVQVLQQRLASLIKYYNK